MRNLQDIVESNLASSAGLLPLVHTTPAYFAQQIVGSKRIVPRACDVFPGEELSYFFLGRPAYKAVGKDTMYWELPSCLICEFDLANIRRVHPFDTGSFAKGFMPSYSTMLPMRDFELSRDTRTIGRYIGTFFGSSENYLKGKPINKTDFIKKHGILPTETSIQALLAILNGERIARTLDERRSAVEIQTNITVNLDDGNIIAIIIPEIYLDDVDFISQIESNGIDVITYPMFPLFHDAYYYAIYERCYNYYKKIGI